MNQGIEGSEERLNDKNDAICVMTCKCEVPFNDLLEVNKKKVCPEHKDGRLDYKKWTCVVCGTEFETTCRVSAASYCKECKYEKKLQANRKVNRQRRAERRERNKCTNDYIDASVEMRHCIERSNCLMKCTSKCLPCLDCEHYKNPEMMYSMG